MVYTRLTQFLGMKPLEHEYKVMGMAPYAPGYVSDRSYDVFKNYLKLDSSGLKIRNTSGSWGDQLIKRFQKDLVTHRFDGICAGAQKLVEEIVLDWVINWVNETNIHDVVLAGGVFMNVKLNMLINENDQIKSAFFMPSCGDESIALGAALTSYVNGVKRNNVQNILLEPLKTLYLGPEYSASEIEKTLNSEKGIKYELCNDINSKVVDYLVDRKNIARFSGKMEFGARSLGNRSILANPNNWESVRKINNAIKKRDFWMPFAPTILDSASQKYLITNGSTKAHYMILGFNTKKDAHNEIIAGLHQSDLSCRPQILEKEWNPDYYDLLEKFENATKISGLLNTSFNIHGYPIVNSPKHALWTLKNSLLDALQLGNFLVTRTK